MAKPNRICSIPDCKKPAHQKGWCAAHYFRWRRNGDPTINLRGTGKFASHTACSVQGCDKRASRRGWCKNHYERWRKHGSPTGGRPSRTPLGEPLGLIRRTIAGDRTDECIIWPYAKNNRGYGTMMFQGHYHTAARVVCILVYGDPPTPNHEAAHSCGNGHLGCFNPDHLRWATVAENMQDKIDHGRSCRGELHSRNKLTETDVRAIRELGRTMLQRDIAALYSVTTTHIGYILSRKTWAWLDD